jgi:hypothetical protein
MKKMNDGTCPLRARASAITFGIDWDAGAGTNDAKKYRQPLRAEAVNALAQQFCTNSGSIGWRYGTKYSRRKKCRASAKPIMAKRTVAVDESRTIQPESDVSMSISGTAFQFGVSLLVD